MVFSFSILGLYFSINDIDIKLIIDNKHSIEKTFPDFFDFFKKNHGMQTEGCIIDEKQYSENKIEFLRNVPYFIIGMRGAGKSNFGKMISKHFRLKYLCMDE